MITHYDVQKMRDIAEGVRIIGYVGGYNFLMAMAKEMEQWIMEKAGGENVTESTGSTPSSKS